MSFKYSGKLSSSKSLFNRALIIKSFKNSLKLEGSSNADDVGLMQQALKNLNSQQIFDCGSAGTVLRFLALRLSREKGEFKLIGSERLLQRPQEELIAVLKELGVEVERNQNSLAIKSNGWQKPQKRISVRAERSSQFASALILSSWSLPFDLEFFIEAPMASESYWRMTIELVKSAGLNIVEEQVKNGFNYLIVSNQTVTVDKILVELDMSSAFALAAFAALQGELQISQWPEVSLQPDSVFLEILKEMGAYIVVKDASLIIKNSKHLKAISKDILSMPDLFPILSVLLALSEGVGSLKGLVNLKYKESDRLSKIIELFKLANIKYEIKNQFEYPELLIYGESGDKSKIFKFKPD